MYVMPIVLFFKITIIAHKIEMIPITALSDLLDLNMKSLGHHVHSTIGKFIHSMLYKIFLGQPFLDPVLYNCTGTEIHVDRHLVLGILYFSMGFMAQILYLFVLKTFWFHEPFWEHACYRIMFFLETNTPLAILINCPFFELRYSSKIPGIPDMLSLIVCAEFAGIWSILGLHSCYNMKFAVFSGCLVFGTWHMSCFYVLILAFNRSCELVVPKFGRLLFSGKPLSIILRLPIFYFIYFAFFTKPLIYDVTESTFLLNPLTKATMNFDPNLYTVYGFIFNNFFCMFFIGVNYFVVCAYLLYHSCSTSIQTVSKIYRQVTVQCMIVCTCHFIGCYLYIHMQYRQLPNVFHVIAQLAWIGNHGLPPLVYLIFNTSIRSKVSLCHLQGDRIAASSHTDQKSGALVRNTQKRITTVM
ncbi:hypothetical protein CRE_07113 [Caenorhabditis remanei]|uniref:Uncharacterized protein n=1 Tax=Caenorhabditis remanei TaxID=31234 RepID=E3NN14_CAERE|nr:hypothetical protein CRE_07113 [Caenorhabditis remanei]